MKGKLSLQILTGISIAAILFHLLILINIIPYSITWGGKLQNDSEMFVFESVSILINSFFLFILLQKGRYIKSIFSRKSLSVLLWIFFGIFTLNTIGNIFADSAFEKSFTLVTFVSAILIWFANRDEAYK